MSEAAGPSTPLAIVAGTGALPRRIAEARRDAGLDYLIVVFPDCREPWMEAHPTQEHAFEKVGHLFRSLRRAQVTHVVFAGAMNRPKLKPWRADGKALLVAVRALRLLGRGDDAMLRGFAAIFEAEGFRMIGPQDILGDGMTIGQGALGRWTPGLRDMADAARAAEIVAALGSLDISQAAVVADGVCLAAEAIEGTDLMLARVATLPAERRAHCPPPGGVLFKGPKPGQDRRMDQPTIGARTVEGVAAAGLAGIVVVADETVLLDPDATRGAADAAGLFVYGATDQELASWRR